MLHKIIDFFCYCGISKEDYNSIKKDVYRNNFRLWKVLHLVMIILLAILFVIGLMSTNIGSAVTHVYLYGLIYSVILSILFLFVLKPDSLIAQILIYLTICILLVGGMIISISDTDRTTVTFIIILLLLSVVKIDKPYIKAGIVIIFDVIYLISINYLETGSVLEDDTINGVIYGILSIVLCVFYSNIRARELLLRKQNEENAKEMLELEKKAAQAEIDRQSALVLNLSEDFECVYYVEVTEDEEEDEIKAYRPTDYFDNLIPGWKDERKFINRLRMLADYFVELGDRENFLKAVNRKTVLEYLKENKAYYVDFVALENGKERFYQIKFTATRSNEGIVTAIVMGLHSIDDEMKKQMQIRAQLIKANEKAEQTIRRRTNELIERTNALQKSNDQIVELVAGIIELRDKESGQHVKRVKLFSRTLARQIKKDWPEYKLTEEDIKTLTSASALHDVGKILIPDSILLKPERYTEEEYKIMKAHCTLGGELLKQIPTSIGEKYKQTALNIVRYHHERWDGKGYPEGLIGDAIPIEAQIVSIADCFETLTSERVYKPPYAKEEALEMILSGQCGAFSEKIKTSLINAKEKFFEICDDPELKFEEKTLQGLGGNRLQGIDLLLVDRNELSLNLNKDILESDGAQVFIADDEEIAFEIFKRNTSIDAVVVDVASADFKELKLAGKIREFEKDTSSFATIIALTMDPSEETEIRIKNFGVDEVMTKPLVIGDFARALLNSMIDHTEIMQRKLQITQIKAHTDALTGVKNVTAYTDKVSELTAEINENENVKFGVVMCDINNLKLVNDTYGHDIGDIYIKSCCRLICEVFKSSPVYRIGGDEFVVILSGSDYENSEIKITEFSERVSKSEKIDDYKNGKASIAAGLARFDKKIDSNVSEVVKRADMLMYNNKRSKKAAENNGGVPKVNGDNAPENS